MIIEIDMDWVSINGQKITRPERISRSFWLLWWEKVKKRDGRDYW